MQVEGREKEQVSKVSAVEVCWELSKTLHLLGNSSERDMVTLLTVTQLSQATIYEKQLTPAQGRAKRELQNRAEPLARLQDPNTSPEPHEGGVGHAAGNISGSLLLLPPETGLPGPAAKCCSKLFGGKTSTSHQRSA